MKFAYSILKVKEFDEDSREITGIATTPSPDRSGDIVEPEGAEFKLPIPLLWQHNSREPIGHVIAAKVTKDGITIRAKLVKVTEPGLLKDRLDLAWQSIKSGLVQGLSIGFKEIEFSRIEQTYSYRYLKWLWLELSAVTIPANAEASIQTIKSLDTSQRAASGLTLHGVVRLSNPPGVSGNVTVNPKGTNMNIAEQLAAYALKRKTALDRMEAIMAKAAETGATLDEHDSEEYDDLQVEVDTIDKHVKRMQAHEAIMVNKGTVVDATSGMALANATSTALAQRGSGIDIGAARQITVTPNLEKGIPFVRYTLAVLAAKGNLDQAAKIARRWKDTSPQVAQCLEFAASEGGHTSALLQKTAVAAGTTSAATWAAPLVNYQDMASEFIELLRPMTILGKLTKLRRVPFNIRIARQTAGVTGAFVGEGAPKPVNALAFDNITLGWYKAAVIVVMTDELLRFSNPAAEALARQDMLDGIAAYLDVRFIDPSYSGVANTSPASITNGITHRGSTGATVAAITADATYVMNSFVTNNLSLQSGAWVMSPSTALKLGMLRNVNDEFVFPGINIGGGTWFGLPVITSNAVASSGSPTEGMIVLLDQNEILLADDGEITIDMSTEASLQMNDAPSAGAQSLVSMFQNNMIALRAERYINFRRRRDAAVAVIGNISY